MLCVSVFSLYEKLFSKPLPAHLHSAEFYNDFYGGGGFQPLITTPELMVRQNRFAFGLLKAHRLLKGANIVVRLYATEGPEAHLAAELSAPYHALEILDKEGQ